MPDREARLRAWHYAALALLVLALLWPGRAGLPPMDRDESRYLQATSQMLATGDLIDVRFQDQPRYLQPAGIYWLEAASVSLLGEAGARPAWAFRVPSLIAGIAAVLMTARIGALLFGPAAGLGAGLLLACSVLLGVEGRLAKIDATQLAVILAAQSALLSVLLDREAGAPARRGPAAIYWLALGCGLMLKGPVILLVSWGTLLGLVVAERRVAWLRRLHPGWGVPLMLLVVLPWCVAIAVVSHGEFFARSVGHNFLGKVASGQEAHGLPPGYHLAAFLIGFWPGSLIAVLAVPFVWRGRRSLPVRFLLAWILPTWIAFEAIATKLPHYVLPAYPAIACLAAAAATGASAWRFGRVWGWVARGYGLVWGLASVALACAGPVLLWWLQDEVLLLPVLAGLVVLGLSGAVLRCVARRQPAAAIGACGLAAAVLAASTYGIVLPRLTAIWISPRVAQAVAALRPCPNSVLASASFSEPSLVFLVGQDTRLVGPAAAADHLAADPGCALALVGSRDTASFHDRAAALGVRPHPLTVLDGINYSTGRRLALTLYDASP